MDGNSDDVGAFSEQRRVDGVLTVKTLILAGVLGGGGSVIDWTSGKVVTHDLGSVEIDLGAVVAPEPDDGGV